MKELSQVLADATRSIEAGYFRLSIDGGDPIYRERVYCYELYHQMRLHWPRDCPFYLNGEIDKSAHPILTELGASYAKPDLLVHQPGYMTRNHAIIEIKSARAAGTGIRKDLNTLSLFINRVNYQRAIFLVYGDEVGGALLRRITQLAARIQNPAQIELWVHAGVGRSATCVQILNATGCAHATGLSQCQ